MDRGSWVSRRLIAAAGAGACLAPAVSACAAARPGLKAPFRTVSPGAVVKLDRKADAPKPLASLGVQSRYAEDDKAKAKVDPAAAKAYDREVAPLREVEREATQHANRYVRSKGATTDHAATCAGVIWRWAKRDALDHMKTEDAHLNRSTGVSALALAWLQVRDAIDREDEARREIERWFDRRGDELRDYYSKKPKDERSTLNNHRYWAGLAAAGAGVASGNAGLLKWGLDSGEIGLKQVDQAGALPLEISRGSRALYYHAYALGPLTLLAEFGARNGRGLYEAHGGALHRLVNFTLQGIDTPATVAARAGAPQERLGEGGAAFDDSDVAWLEIYAARFAARNPWTGRMEKLRPLVLTRLGGDLTLLYGG